MKCRIISAVVFSLMVMNVAAMENGIVKIGGEVFDRSAIESVMKANNLPDPFVAIEVLKQQVMARQLAEKRKLDTTDPEKSLYFAISGQDLAKDLALENTKDIPLSMSRPASLRKGLFEQWLTVLAEQRLPVNVIDYDKLWEIFKQTDAYKIRVENNQDLKPENMVYTWGELSVDPAKVLATQKGKALVSGEEFNAYLKLNQTAINLFGKRAKSPAEVRSDIVHLMVAGMLLNEECRKNKEQFSDVEIERAVSDLVRDNMIDEDFNLKNMTGETLSDYMDILNRQSVSKNKVKSDKLRSAMRESAQIAEKEYDIKVSVMHAAFTHSEVKIHDAINDNEVYEWMKEKSFKGAAREARMVMGHERHKKHIDELVKSEQVVFSVE